MPLLVYQIIFMVHPAGIEPAALGSANLRSIH
jgi:hypothetical protein